ncbi:MAG: restriction endonuclease [Methylococcaceae bacterium]
MKTCITVREYAQLTTTIIETPSLDKATVSLSAFDYLCKLSVKCRKTGANLVQQERRTSLRLDNYVGVIETPCGTMLEILPKYVDEASDAATARQLLCRMLQAILNLPAPREVGAADVAKFKRPLHEWVMAQFLAQLDVLIKRGIRFDYQRIEEEQRYLRGQLNVVGQMRQPLGRQHFFQIRHDVFLPDRPENRLIKAALDKICAHTQQPDSWRLAHELAGRMTEIPRSRQIAVDFKCWHQDRNFFQLKPDLMLMQGNERWIMDCKWKRVDGTLRAYGDDLGVQKYGLSQSDFYQLFAYGQKYLNGNGEMVLIFPQTAKFSAPLPAFHFSDDLYLWVLPFDLNEGVLILSPNMRLPIKNGRMTEPAMIGAGAKSQFNS